MRFRGAGYVGLGMLFGYIAGSLHMLPTAFKHAPHESGLLPPAQEQAEAGDLRTSFPKKGRILFSGGLACEGREGVEPLTQWEITCMSRHLAVSGDAPPQAELPESLLAANPANLALQVAGWSRVELKIPPVDEQGDCVVTSPIVLHRQMAGLCLNMPNGGTDYDSAEITWVRSLDEEPRATPPKHGQSVLLNFKTAGSCVSLPTGIYKLTLKSRTPARIREFVLAPELALRQRGEHPESPSVSISLPPSLSRTYTGFGGASMTPQSAEGPTGIVCGLNINVRDSSGDFILVFQPLDREQTLRYGTLKPRPDTIWPITNLFLEDPVRLAFDCPLSHADHRMTIFAADGRISLVPTFIAPENDRQQSDMFDRMRALIQAQVRTAGQKSAWFDPRYLNLPAEQLPNFANLLSRERFAWHLSRIARNPVKPFELGSRVTVRLIGGGMWDVQVGRTD